YSGPMGPCSSFIRYFSPLFPPKLMRHSQANSKLLNLFTLTKSPPPTCGIKCRHPFSTFHLLVGKVGCPNPRHWSGFPPSNSSRQPACLWSCVREGCGSPPACPQTTRESAASQSRAKVATVDIR